MRQKNSCTTQHILALCIKLLLQYNSAHYIENPQHAFSLMELYNRRIICQSCVVGVCTRCASKRTRVHFVCASVVFRFTLYTNIHTAIIVRVPSPPANQTHVASISVIPVFLSTHHPLHPSNMHEDKSHVLWLHYALRGDLPVRCHAGANSWQTRPPPPPSSTCATKRLTSRMLVSFHLSLAIQAFAQRRLFSQLVHNKAHKYSTQTKMAELHRTAKKIATNVHACEIERKTHTHIHIIISCGCMRFFFACCFSLITRTLELMA